MGCIVCNIPVDEDNWHEFISDLLSGHHTKIVRRIAEILKEHPEILTEGEE